MNKHHVVKFSATIFCFFLLAFSCHTGLAQLKDTDKYMSIGVFVGTAHYSGDLSKKAKLFSTDLSLTEPSLGIGLEKRLDPRFSAAVAIQWARLLGDDINAPVGSANYNRNLHFRNDLVELSVLGKWDLLASYGHYSNRRKWVPFIFGGIAAIHHNPRGKTAKADGGIWVPLQPLKTENQTEKYKRLGWTVPLGVGFQFRDTEKIDISLEAGLRFTYTDFLDDVSGNYPEAASFGENALARAFSDRSLEPFAARTDKVRTLPVNNNITAGSLRGDSKNADKYLITGFKIKYLLSKNKKKSTLSRLHSVNTPKEILMASEKATTKGDSTFLRFRERYSVEHLAINSPYSEMSPKFYQGGLVFISDRRDNKNFEKQARSGFHNFFYSPIHDLFKNELTKPIFLKDKKYSKHHHFAADYISSQQKIILLYMKSLIIQ